METITTSEIDPFMCGFTILAVMMARSTLRAGRVFSLLYFPVELASTISASQVLEKALRRAGIARTRRRNADLAGGFSLRHEDRRAGQRYVNQAESLCVDTVRRRCMAVSSFELRMSS